MRFASWSVLLSGIRGCVGAATGIEYMDTVYGGV